MNVNPGVLGWESYPMLNRIALRDANLDEIAGTNEALRAGLSEAESLLGSEALSIFVMTEPRRGDDLMRAYDDWKRQKPERRGKLFYQFVSEVIRSSVKAAGREVLGRPLT